MHSLLSSSLPHPTLLRIAGVFSTRAATRRAEKEWGDALISGASEQKQSDGFDSVNLKVSVDVPDSAKTSARSKLVEFGHFPGFTEAEPCDLPGIKSSLEYMIQVCCILLYSFVFFWYKCTRVDLYSCVCACSLFAQSLQPACLSSLVHHPPATNT